MISEDHVTLKTEVMSFESQEYISFLKYIEIEKNILNCNIIFEYYYFNCIFHQINEAVMKPLITNNIINIKKYIVCVLLTPNYW